MSDFSFLKKTKCFVLDLDGTVYLDGTPIGDMVATLDVCRKKGIKIVYFTNNSSKTAEEYEIRLKKTGLFRDGDIVYTSAMATASFLNENFKGKRTHVLASDSVKETFLKSGILLDDVNPEVCVLCYDLTMTFKKIKRFNEFLVRGAVFVATHPDTVCPTSDISMPDLGSFFKLFESSSGRTPDFVIGKPNDLAGKAIAGLTGFNPDEITMVGDRLYTDIAFGVNSGFKTLLVLSGETKREMLDAATVKPTGVMDDFNDVVKVL